MAFKLDYKESQLSKNLDKLSEKMGAAVLVYAATTASVLESKMKARRRWTDRTGMAKARLSAKVSRPDDDTIRITLAHGVDYGIWLEFAHEKKYAIIYPTIQRESPAVMKGLSKLMNKIKLRG